jgi:SagB-type dehydrogenase family enzyme
MIENSMENQIEAAFQFLDMLRGDPKQMNDENWHNEDFTAQWPIKVYQGLNRIALPDPSNWWQVGSDSHTKVASDNDDRTTENISSSFKKLSDILAKSYLISKIKWQHGGTILSSPQRPGLVWPNSNIVTRRPIASGGAMYPTQIYLCVHNRVIKSETSSNQYGIYHYNPANHELVELEAHVSASRIYRAIERKVDFERHQYSVEVPPIVAIFTDRFCQNMVKYANFAYRLGSVDLGVLVGRMVGFAASEFENCKLSVDFDDVKVAQICQLDIREEGINALLCLGECMQFKKDEELNADYCYIQNDLVQYRGTLPKLPKSLMNVHLLASESGLVPPEDLIDGVDYAASVAKSISLSSVPEQNLSLPQLVKRSSEGALFTGESISTEQLSIILKKVTSDLLLYKNIYDHASSNHIELYCAIESVTLERGEGIVPPSWYRYNAQFHELEPTAITEQKPSTILQEAMHLDTANISLSALSIHIVSNTKLRSDPRVVRGYRVQQMLIGMVVDSITKWSAHLNIGSHPYLGFDVTVIDKMYGLLGTEMGVHAQVMLGKSRPSGTLGCTVCL